MIDEATFQRFGYHLKDVAPGSHKKVVCYCPKCEQYYETQRRYHRDGRLCWACNSRQLMNSIRDAQAMMKTIQAHNKASREKGLSPRGLPLFPGSEAEYKKLHQEAHREKYNASQRKRRQTLIGKVSNRLRVALRKYLQGRRGGACFICLIQSRCTLSLLHSTQKEGETYYVLAGLFHRTRFGRIGSSGTGYKHVQAPP